VPSGLAGRAVLQAKGLIHAPLTRRTRASWAVAGLLLAACAAMAGEGPPLSFLGLSPLARVVIAEDPRATEDFRPEPMLVQRLVNRGLTNLTGQASVAAAWRSLVSTQDVVGIKVYTAPGPNIGTRPAVAEAVVRGLLSAGFPPRNIVIWDKQIHDLRQAGFVELAQRLGVRAAGAAQAGWDATVFYDYPFPGVLVPGDLEFNENRDHVGRKSFVSKLVTKDMTKIINLSPMLNHNSAGVCGSLLSLALGSVDNSLRFEHDTTRLAQVLPEIYALPVLGDRVVLNIVDGLIAQYEGEQVGRLHYSAMLNQLRLSTDPVAVDVLSLEELSKLREVKGGVARGHTNVTEIYRNASLLEIGVSEMRQIRVEHLK
jgi:hypothetical protein